MANSRRAAPVTLRPLDRSLTISLLRAREAVMARFRPVLKRHGVTEQQWRVIRVLAERQRCDATELAAASCIHAASLSRILRDLQAGGVLDARASRADSRRLAVELTPAGRRAFRRIGAQSEAIYRRIEAEVGATELAATLERVHQLTERLALPPIAAGRARRAATDAT
jgi:homoprotocatechuate degradation regulator HpaR